MPVVCVPPRRYGGPWGTTAQRQPITESVIGSPPFCADAGTQKVTQRRPVLAAPLSDIFCIEGVSARPSHVLVDSRSNRMRRAGQGSC